MSTPGGMTEGYRRYALAVLAIVYVVNFVDRQILSILAEDIRKEIDLSDTQLGVLSGVAFALFYTFAGIPIARWADTGSRRTIISLALFIWSGMTALTGFAQSFAHLLAARIGVGIGEAGGTPPSHSMISDMFPPERRATALALYSLGIPIGGAVGSILGGWLSWRTAFIAAGLFGVVLSVVVRLTLKEPPRGVQEGASAGAQDESVGEVLGFMMRLPSFVHMSFGAALHALYGYGAAYFVPVFLIRVHLMDKLEVGTWLFAIGLTTGVIGISLGGAISDRLAARDARWYMRVPAYASIAAVPFAVLFYLWPDPRTAILLSIPGTLVGGVYLGPTFAMTQTLVKPHMRALASAILLFIINLIGLGGGPLLVGMLSDYLRPTYGDESVRYSLLYIVSGGGIWATLHYLLAARTLRRDLEAKHA